MWKNVEQPDRPQMTIEDGACALQTAHLRLHTHTHIHTRSKYVTFLASTRQQWLRERASMFRLYLHCLLCSDLAKYHF
jgi:hypothetical protein